MTEHTFQGTPVITEHPQKVFEKKKQIFRLNQIVWYILGVMEVLLAFRIVLKMLAANNTGFTNFIYAVTGPMAEPFRGIFGLTRAGGSIFEWTTILAMVVYLVVAWGIVYLLDIVNPVTPEEVESSV